MDFDSPRLLELLRNPAEDLAFEIKDWLDLTDNAHKAKLAQAMIALANHGGGSILVGFTEQADGSFVPGSSRPADLNAYTTDTINEISRTYLNPPIHCDVRQIAHPVSGLLFPVVKIPGGHLTPVIARRGGPQGQSSLSAGRTYIRRAGPSSEEPQSPEEWRDLLDRCVRAGREELVDRIRLIVSGQPVQSPANTEGQEFDLWIDASTTRWQELIAGLPATHPAHFQRGYYRFAYQLRGEFSPPTLANLRTAIVASEVRHSGWPHWPVITRDPVRPAPVGDTIECLMARDNDSAELPPDRLDYWRVSTHGKAFTVRGFAEDSHADLVEPGVGIDITTPTWRLADAVTHAANLARALGMTTGDIDFDILWTGLAGRQLVSVGNPRRYLSSTRTTHQQQYQRRFSVKVDTVLDQLPEVVDTVLRPMYEAFDFFNLPGDLTASEIAEWRRNN
jgi:hypothetical protein